MFRDDLIAELAAMTHQERMQLWELAWQSSAGQPKRVVTGCRAALCCNAGEKLNVPRVARAFRKAEPDMGVEEAILTARELVAEGELSEVVYFHNQYASLEDAYVITSYSIHYTKLYDLLSSGPAEPESGGSTASSTERMGLLSSTPTEPSYNFV